MKTKAFSFTHRTKVIAGGTVRKNNDVTSGELAESPGGTGVKRTYKRKRSGEQRSVSSRPAEYYR